MAGDLESPIASGSNIRFKSSALRRFGTPQPSLSLVHNVCVRVFYCGTLALLRYPRVESTSHYC